MFLMKLKNTGYCFLWLLFSGWSMSNFASENTQWKNADIAPLTTELVLELTVNIGATVNVGKSDHGSRRFIPITGGSFVGAGLKGEVIPGGADWQLTRADGVIEIDALYSIRTDDDAVIVVHNKGIVARHAASEMTPAKMYVRSSPVFHAPEGKYGWLNKTVFTGTITPAQDGSHVLIRVFKIN